MVVVDDAAAVVVVVVVFCCCCWNLFSAVTDDEPLRRFLRELYRTRHEGNDLDDLFGGNTEHPFFRRREDQEFIRTFCTHP